MKLNQENANVKCYLHFSQSRPIAVKQNKEYAIFNFQVLSRNYITNSTISYQLQAAFCT